ncbi:hypothetical protein L0668_05655 [Paraglaciecola aquimarina]|uniref:Uncharacterized protein n=1 Tax=Paraglaciecola algarum TaxID=3050085 RepID=A0ABS9D3T0_9ALTE|nr:hypothetical protein [Paraglaciecola sp. G1-23]MCF2947585.1 hypothetical protein [Paraglaciecola sp. G1-23]
MDVVLLVFLIFFVLILLYVIYQKYQANQRIKFIANYEFPISLKNKVAKVYPHISSKDLERVIRGLRDYFYIINLSQNQIVAMPSQVVDVAWHEFILFTREYAQFCSKGLGRFLHHTPAEAMKSKDRAQSGIKRAWRIACHKEQINPHKPKRLPIIFALDASLNIEDGFHYELNCMKSNSTTSGGGNISGGHCGSHIGCSSGCAGSAGDGGCAGDSGGGGGCGGD